jgi:hypothetical protein
MEPLDLLLKAAIGATGISLIIYMNIWNWKRRSKMTKQEREQEDDELQRERW